MQTYLLELYAPRATARDVAARAQQAADELSAEGTSIRYVRTVLVPADETCFHLYEADTVDAVHTAATRAGFGEGRIVEAITAQSPLDGLPSIDEKETARTP